VRDEPKEAIPSPRCDARPLARLKPSLRDPQQEEIRRGRAVLRHVQAKRPRLFPELPVSPFGKYAQDVPLPDEQLEKLRRLRLEQGSTATVDVGEVWEVPKGLVAFVVEGKNRPHLVAGLLGGGSAVSRAYAIEGTSQPQKQRPPLCLTLDAGEAGVRTETHFVFVPFRVRRFDVSTIVDDCMFWGRLSAERLQDLEAAIAASRIVVLRRSRRLPEVSR
jgi:hypothetical protein